MERQTACDCACDVCPPSFPGLDSAEYFDPRTGEWKTISCMSVRRSSVGVGVVGSKSLIIIFLLKTELCLLIFF